MGKLVLGFLENWIFFTNRQQIAVMYKTIWEQTSSSHNQQKKHKIIYWWFWTSRSDIIFQTLQVIHAQKQKPSGSD